MGGIGDAIPLTVGYTDFGRNPGVSTSVFIPDGGAVGDSGDGPSADIDRNILGLLWFKELAIVNGGSLLIRLPALLLSSNCFASNLLCAAKASRGDSSGGTSPATHNRGDGRPLLGDGIPVPKGPCDCDRRSIKFGRVVIVSKAVRDGEIPDCFHLR